MRLPALLQRTLRQTFSWSVALGLYGLRWTTRYEGQNTEVMDRLRAQGRSYVYAQLHAHQVGGCFYGEKDVVVMVSRSDDGAMLVPTLKIFGKTFVRGSSGTGRKGGATALVELIRVVKAGRPAGIAVDGPRGPRGTVQKGVVKCAQKAGVPIIPVVMKVPRRWVLSRTWDRLQVPKPFSKLTLIYGEPIELDPQASMQSIADQVFWALHDLESEHDPTERPAQTDSKRHGPRPNQATQIDHRRDDAMAEAEPRQGGEAGERHAA